MYHMILNDPIRKHNVLSCQLNFIQNTINDNRTICYIIVECMNTIWFYNVILSYIYVSVLLNNNSTIVCKAVKPQLFVHA